MAPLSRAIAPASRAWTRHTLSRPSAAAVAFPKVGNTQTRGRADASSNLPGNTRDAGREHPGHEVNPRFAPNTSATEQTSSTFDSVWHRSGGTMRDTHQIPSFAAYKSSKNETTNKVFSYFMVGGLGAITAMGAKATVQDFLVNMAASADVLAQAKVEISLGAIPEGKNVIIKWRGKPVFIRHRTESEISEARETKWESLRDPQPDEDRVQKPEWLIMVGVCTHLGCVPIGEAGDFGGWFCPCHGSHYDISGRARKGPAPLNLEIPLYSFPSDDSLVIG